MQHIIFIVENTHTSISFAKSHKNLSIRTELPVQVLQTQIKVKA